MMELKTREELSAVVSARKLAKRDGLRREAQGLGRWTVGLTSLPFGAAYVAGMWFEGPPSLTLTLLFVLVAGELAYLGSRIAAIAALVELVLDEAQDVTRASA